MSSISLNLTKKLQGRRQTRIIEKINGRQTVKVAYTVYITIILEEKYCDNYLKIKFIDYRDDCDDN